MKLIYHPRSPYSRKAYMVAMKTGLADSISLETVVVAPVHFPGWSDNVPDVAQYNPLAKLPTLVLDDGVTGIFDSRTICDYLVAHRQIPAPTTTAVDDQTKWRLRTLHACADGMMDAMVLCAYESKIREPKGLKMQAWEDGQKEKIQRAFRFVEHEIKAGVLKVEGSDLGAEAAIAAAIGSLGHMGLNWSELCPNLKLWFDNYSKTEQFTTTVADRDWKSGQGVKLLTVDERAARLASKQQH